MTPAPVRPGRRGRAGLRRRAGALLASASLGLGLSGCAAVAAGAPGPPALPRIGSAIPPAPAPGAPSGLLSAPGGPFLYDNAGRVVFLHGVNAVYKRPPFELYPDPGKPWNLSEHDASLMARLGFNVVRLGMTWRGLEPGTAPPNDPALCARGLPRDPKQFNHIVLDRYLTRLKRTVDLLGRYHIYSLLDMHQDVYNELFDGEGAPNWAVCTNGIRHGDPPGRWSANYGSAAADTAFAHFWHNNVVGDLQGEYDRVWAAVAAFFRNDPWVVGYDPFNEPFSVSLVTRGDEQFDGQLECFYTGRAHIGRSSHTAPATRCPKQDPAQGVIPRILAADPEHLIFYEPDIFGSRGRPNFVGAMRFPNLVFNVHIYCSFRSGTTGNPTDLTSCASQEVGSLTRRHEDRTELGSPRQKTGPAWFVSEFGATSNAPLLSAVTAKEDSVLVGWTYWSWKHYGDPTGSDAEALVLDNGRLRPTARVLSRTYPEAVAGIPTSMSFDPATGLFSLHYVPRRAVQAPTVIFVPVELHYPRGYCARVSGGRVTSGRDAVLLQVANSPGAQRVSVVVRSGPCPRRGGGAQAPVAPAPPRPSSP